MRATDKKKAGEIGFRIWNAVSGWAGLSFLSVRRRAIFGSLAVLALSVLVASQIAYWNKARLLAEQRSSVEAKLQHYGNTLSNEIHRHFSQLEGLAALVRTHPMVPELEDGVFETFAQGLYATGKGLRAIQAFPAEGPVMVYPVDRNRATVGRTLDMLINDTRPNVRDDVRRAIETRQVALSGPYELRQGGLGLIARQAVYLGDTLWGLIVVIIDVPPVLETAGLLTPPQGISLALRAGAGRVIHGPDWIFLHDPVIYPVDLPEGAWQLAAAPTVGWRESFADEAMRFRTMGILIMFMVTLLAYLLLDRQTRLVDAVRVRTAELAKSVIERERNEQKFHQLYTAMTQGVIHYDADGKVVSANPAAEKILGFTSEQMCGRASMASVWLAIGEDGSDLAEDALPARVALRTGKIVRDTVFGIYNSEMQKIRWLSMDAVPQYFPDQGAPYQVFATFEDITDKKSTEDQLRHAQKMEAIGELTGGLAHDLNNALGIISINLSLLNKRSSDDDLAPRHYDAATKGVSRAAELTRKLLDFSRTENVETKHVSVNEFVRGMESLIAKSLTPAVSLQTNLADDTWLADIDPGNLEDSILNLALNAGDAMPDGGTLFIETANKVIDEEYVQRNPGSTAGDFVMVAVSDTGIGMAPDTLKRVFEPFFTTKESGKGTGLGLSMVYGFVQRSGGHVKIYSELGSGSTVRIYLPRAEGQMAAEITEAGKRQTPRGRGESVLVVDDEQDLADAAVRILDSLGYRAVSAATGVQALDILQNDAGIDLLFSDVIMPGGMDGYRLAADGLKIRPDLKVLLTSGFTRKREEAARGNDVASELTRTLLHKPYNMDELGIAVRRALDG